MSARRVLRTGGLKFDGKDDYVRVANSPMLNIGGTELTLTAWFNPYRVPPPVWSKVISKAYASNSWNPPYIQYCLGQVMGAGTFDFAVSIGSTFYVARGGPLVPYRWTFAAGVFNGELPSQNMKLYLAVEGVYDLELAATEDVRGTINARDTDIYIGKSYWTGNTVNWEIFQGLIDKVAIYNRALSEDEIRDIYNKGVYPKNGLVLLLDFTEYKGTIAYDKSGFGNHGTIYGAEWVIKKAYRVLAYAK
jgi:hypothetical protein